MFAGAERIDRLLMETGHRAFTEQMDVVQTMADEKRGRDTAGLQREILSKRTQEAPAVQREMLTIMADMQHEFSKSMQDYVGLMSAAVLKSGASTLNREQSREAPVASNAFGGISSFWTSAFEQFAALANRNLEAARSGYEEASNAANSATRYMADQARAATGEAVSAAADAAEEAADELDDAAESVNGQSGYSPRHAEKKSRAATSARRR
jgi:hypothetical protein